MAMKSILLPTDFSKNSLNAIKFALQMFEHQDCRFYLLNVQKVSSFITDDFMHTSASATVYNTIIDAAKRSLNNLISNFQDKFKNPRHEFQPLLDYDSLVDSVNQVIQKFSIELIIMGTQGASGLQKVFFGSNTMHVVEKCDIPVLVIPTASKFKKFSKVMFAGNIDDVCKITNSNMLSELLQINKSLFFLLDTSNNMNSKNLDDLICQNSNPIFKEAKHLQINAKNVDLLTEIKKKYKTHGIKLLVITNKKHSLLEKLFSNKIIENLAFEIDIPLLIFPISS